MTQSLSLAFIAVLAASIHAQSPAAQPPAGQPPTAQPPSQSTGAAPQGIIRVAGKAFVDDNCNEFVPVGWNQWGSPLIQQAKAAVSGSASDAAQVSSLFQTAKANGMNTMRIFGTGVENTSVLQPADGVYDESTFQAFDYILNEAAKNNIKVLWMVLLLGVHAFLHNNNKHPLPQLIWAFTTHWQKQDAPGKILEWCGICSLSDPSRLCQPSNYDQFWTNECARTKYKNHVSTVVNRVNTVNGRYV